MRFITLLIAAVIFSTAVSAIYEDGNRSYIFMVKGQEELKTLKEIHNYNEVFDNYHLGGIAPDITPQKGK